MTDISIIIPSRNEMFLGNTIQNLLENIQGDTDITVVLDGQWPNEPLPVHPKVSIIYHNQSIGQRAAMNEAAKISNGRYIMKVDAHCCFDKGFDIKLLNHVQPNWTIVPMMLNLHAFDWVCGCGCRIYQGPTPEKCPQCGKAMHREIIWKPRKDTPHSTSYCFDPEPHFQYFGAYKSRPEGKGELTETMSLQGSCFMLSREKYFELNIADEEFGSWGSQGIEVAIKTWLSGGRVVCDQTTWYAHMFRTQGGDFGFPYALSGNQVEHAKKTAKNIFFNNKWEKQIHPLSWLIEKFWPVPGWTQEDLDKLKSISVIKSEPEVNKKLTSSLLYYTDNQLDNNILLLCQEQLKRCANGNRIISVSLKPIDFGDNIVLSLERGYLTMFKQILAGLEEANCDIIYFCEHDVLYHRTHFSFIPPKPDRYYYNLNVWKVDANTGHALHYDTKQTSGLVAYRDLLLQHYRIRVERTEQKLNELGNSHEFRNWIRRQGFEPGSHHRSERVDNYESEIWQSEVANIDIRHDRNLTSSRWKKEQFRDQHNCQNWQETDDIPGWGEWKEIFHA